MIKVFGVSDTTFNNNGDVVIRPIKARVHKKDNSDYYLELETGLEFLDFITQGRIVIANTPTGEQAFRIGNVKKTRNKVSTRCNHVFFDSKNYLIKSATVTEADCDTALDILNNATEPQSAFTTLSDVIGNNNYTCEKKSLYGAINDVLNLYGGHLVRDNFSIAIRSTIGADNGIIVQYKKNLRDISCAENWDNVVTKLLPVGKEGIMLNSLDISVSPYVTSATQYSIPYTKTVSFQQNIDQADYQTETEYQQALIDDLRIKAQDYVNTNCLPKVNYTLKANLEKLSDIGDTIEVIDERLGINLTTNVIAFTYNCITELYDEVEFGNFAETISGFYDNILSTVKKMIEEG